MTNEQIIRDAISRSISHTEIVNIEIDESNIDRIHDLVAATTGESWDYSSENCDAEGREVLDVYSLDDASDQWRIKVTFAG